MKGIEMKKITVVIATIIIGLTALQGHAVNPIGMTEAAKEGSKDTDPESYSADEATANKELNRMIKSWE
jgi:hypothetical protein